MVINYWKLGGSWIGAHLGRGSAAAPTAHRKKPVPADGAQLGREKARRRRALPYYLCFANAMTSPRCSCQHPTPRHAQSKQLPPHNFQSSGITSPGWTNSATGKL